MHFQKDAYIFYRCIGICQMIAIEEQCMDGKTSVQYYKLKPISEQNSTYYVPVSISQDKLRPLLTKAEVLELIDSMHDCEGDDVVWSDNRRVRKEMYATALKSDDYREISNLIIGLYSKKRTLELKGRRISSMDEAAMRNADHLMTEEFCFVLGLNESELRRFIADRLEHSENEHI